MRNEIWSLVWQNSARFDPGTSTWDGGGTLGRERAAAAASASPGSVLIRTPPAPLFLDPDGLLPLPMPPPLLLTAAESSAAWPAAGQSRSASPPSPRSARAVDDASWYSVLLPLPPPSCLIFFRGPPVLRYLIPVPAIHLIAASPALAPLFAPVRQQPCRATHVASADHTLRTKLQDRI
jgi:hypothetical protein